MTAAVGTCVHKDCEARPWSNGACAVHQSETAKHTVYVFKTEYEGQVEITLYATKERAELAAKGLIEDWLTHETHMLGVDMIWSTQQPDRVEGAKARAVELWPMRKALNDSDIDAAIDLYNEAGEEHDGDWACAVYPEDVTA